LAILPNSDIILLINLMKVNTLIIGEIQTSVGIVPQVSTQLKFSDKFGSWKARWSFNRMNYKVTPGLYAVSTPHNNSSVLVTANYKMTFDVLRKELAGLDAWILVLDTKGINVWCAAAKGTFSTNELINRINEVKLSQVISHKTIIVPQLGAVGISAHEVAKISGFKVIYGPVNAKDIKGFIDSGMKAAKEMRTVKFDIFDRLALIPMELVCVIKPSIIILGLLFLLNLFKVGSFGIIDLYAYIGVVITGCVLTPILLPWISGSALAWKGWLLGFIWTVIIIMFSGWTNIAHYGWLKPLAYLLILPSVSAFFAMNFTGATTYTSFSGVIKEMKIAVPAMIFSVASGIILILLNSFIKF
jgi:hypothetical protein